MIDVAIENGISARLYRQRLGNGWTKERAATKPVYKRYTGDYAIYKKGELVVMGSRKECAEFLGVSEKYIQWMTTRSVIERRNKRENPEMATAAIRLDDDEDDE